MRSAPAIGFECKPSRALSVCIVLLTGVAVIAVVSGGLPRWAAMLLAIVALGYGMAALWRHRHPRVAALTWRGDGGASIRVVRRGGEPVEVEGALQDARVLGSLIVLHLRWPGGRAGVWILPDNLDADTRRRLRVRLGSDGARGASVNADSV